MQAAKSTGQIPGGLAMMRRSMSVYRPSTVVCTWLADMIVSLLIVIYLLFSPKMLHQRIV